MTDLECVGSRWLLWRRDRQECLAKARYCTTENLEISCGNQPVSAEPSAELRTVSTRLTNSLNFCSRQEKFPYFISRCRTRASRHLAPRDHSRFLVPKCRQQSTAESPCHGRFSAENIVIFCPCPGDHQFVSPCFGHRRLESRPWRPPNLKFQFWTVLLLFRPTT